MTTEQTKCARLRCDNTELTHRHCEANGRLYCTPCSEMINKLNGIQLLAPIARNNDQNHIGVYLGQQLTSALSGNGIPYETLAKIVYGELAIIAAAHETGDWLTFPDGTTYTCTFKPEKKS